MNTISTAITDRINRSVYIFWTFADLCLSSPVPYTLLVTQLDSIFKQNPHPHPHPHPHQTAPKVDSMLKNKELDSPVHFVTMILLVFANAIQYNYPRIAKTVKDENQFPYEVCEVAAHLGSFLTWEVFERPKLVDGGVVDLTGDRQGQRLSKVSETVPSEAHPPWIVVELNNATRLVFILASPRLLSVMTCSLFFFLLVYQRTTHCLTLQPSTSSKILRRVSPSKPLFNAFPPEPFHFRFLSPFSFSLLRPYQKLFTLLSINVEID